MSSQKQQFFSDAYLVLMKSEDYLRQFIRESLDFDEDYSVNNAHFFIKKWYKDHRVVSSSSIKFWQRMFSYSGPAFRALMPDVDPEAKGTTSWSKSLVKLEAYTKEVEPTYNGCKVVSAEVVGALDLEKMCQYILKKGQTSEEVKSILPIGEIVNFSPAKNLADYGIVGRAGLIKKVDD